MYPRILVTVTAVALLGCGQQRGTTGAAALDQSGTVQAAAVQPAAAPQPGHPAPPSSSATPSGSTFTSPVISAEPAPDAPPGPAPNAATRPLPEPRAEAAYEAPQPAPFVIPARTRIRVRLDQTLDTRYTRAGGTFSATLDEPIVAGNRVAVPKGTRFTGEILASQRSGRFRGRARLELTLLSFSMEGRTYPVQTAADTRVSGGHKKRNWILLGGVPAAGAGIGALAAGGTGALIGAGVGAAAGTTTAFFTGRKNVDLPVETPMVFSLRSGIAVPRG
jgi:hypothetical protein